MKKNLLTNGGRETHLHPRILEQWVYRHWTHSPYCCLELDKLSWRLERWRSTRIIDEISMPGWTLDPEHDYQAFNRFGKHPTARAMDPRGEWDYPIIVLFTPEGIRDRSSEQPDARYLLIEGHCRRRYLNALMARGKAASEQDVFLIEYR